MLKDVRVVIMIFQYSACFWRGARNEQSACNSFPNLGRLFVKDAAAKFPNAIKSRYSKDQSSGDSGLGS